MPNVSPRLAELLERLRIDLGGDAFDVVDHWQDDPYAVGIARPDDHRYLVYVSVLADDGSIAYECESPPSLANQPYDSTGMVDAAAYQQLSEAVIRHLAIRR